MKVANLRLIDDLESEALSKQWLEYLDMYMKNIITPSSISLVLTELNLALSAQSYLGGNTMSSADYIARGLVSDLMKRLSFYEKEKLIHLCRWYNTLQSCNEENEFKLSRTVLYC